MIGTEGEKIIAAIVLPFDNMWMQALLGVGLLCASMSTIDTCTNIVSLNISRDLLQIRKLFTSKVINALVVGVTFFVSINVESLWDIFYLSSGLLSTAVALPVLATLRKDIPSRAAFLSSLFGFISTVFFYFNGIFGWVSVTLGQTVQDTGLAYIVFGMIGAAAGFFTGYFFAEER